jgi:hypothetical protein
VKSLKMKTIGAPVKTARHWTWAVAPDANGKWQYIGQYYNYPYGKKGPDPEWIIVDLETGTQKTVSLPGYANMLYSGDSLMRSKNGRLFFATGDGRIHYYEPKENTIKSLGLMFPRDKGYRLLYRQIQSPDGMIYMGTQSNNGQPGLVQLDPETLKTKSFPKVAGIQRVERLTYVYYLASDPPWVYLAVGKGRWRLAACNLKTGESKILDDNCSWISFKTYPYGVRAGLQKIDPATKKKTSSYVWCQDGKLYPEIAGKRPKLPGKTLKERFPAFFADKPASKAPPVKFHSPGRDGKIKLVIKPGVGRKGKTLYGKIKYVRPTSLESLTVLPDGDLFGNGRQYNGFFRYNPKSGKIDYFGKHGPSRPVLTTYQGKIYFSGYPSGATYVYDPNKPWRDAKSMPRPARNEVNPKQLKYLGSNVSGAHYAYTLTSASNGRLYFLGRLERGHQGSGVAYYNVRRRRAKGHHKNLNFIKPSNMLVMDDLKRVLISGRLIRKNPYSNEKPPTETKVVVFDMDLKELDRLQIKKGLSSTGHLYPAQDKNEFIGVINHEGIDAIYRYNLKEKKLVKWLEVDDPIDKLLIRPADNTYWTIQGDTLGKLDPVSLKITPVGTLPQKPAFFAWSGNKLYGTVGGDLIEFDPKQ